MYTNGVKTNFAKRLEISGIEVYPGHFTASFEDTIDAILKKSFPRDHINQNTPHHTAIRLEAELNYNGKDDVLF